MNLHNSKYGTLKMHEMQAIIKSALRFGRVNFLSLLQFSLGRSGKKFAALKRRLEVPLLNNYDQFQTEILQSE
jgi:hypothetical protein